MNRPGSARAKVYYIGPNFRFERPQAGRLRQHHQFGVEAFGVAEPEQDVECILLQMEFYRRCGVRDLELQVNSLGDRESKQRYRDALVASSDAIGRIPERGFAAPAVDQSRCAFSTAKTRAIRSFAKMSRRRRRVCRIRAAAHFERVQKLLSRFKRSLSRQSEPRARVRLLHRNLWEVVAGGLGAQNALGGGGRYDALVEQLGGRATPGVGFGSGLERLLLALEGQGVQLPQPEAKLVWLVSQGEPRRMRIGN